MATQRFFMFTPKIGKMIQFDDHIFQLGLLQPPTSNGINHKPQLVIAGFHVWNVCPESSCHENFEAAKLVTLPGKHPKKPPENMAYIQGLRG